MIRLEHLRFGYNGGDDVLLGFATGRQAAVASMQPMLRAPGVFDDRGRRAPLAFPQGVTEEGVMAVVPGGFDEHATQMGVAGFGDVSAGACDAAGVFRGDEAGKGHEAGRGGKPTRIAQFGGDGQGGEVVDPAEAPQARGAGAERFDREQVPQLEVDRLQPAEGFVDGADVGAMGLFEGGQRPALRLKPLAVALGPGLLSGGKAAAVPEARAGAGWEVAVDGCADDDDAVIIESSRELFRFRRGALTEATLRNCAREWKETCGDAQAGRSRACRVRSILDVQMSAALVPWGAV